MLDYLESLLHRKGFGISFLVPFNCTDKDNPRYHNWQWLKKYWRSHFPFAQIVVGRDEASENDSCIPFSKSVAVNDAARRAHGDIFVIIDADGFLATDMVLTCATRIRRARRRGHRLWFVPYRQFYRLTPKASKRLLESSPKHPYKFSTPPDWCDILNTSGSQHGHWYGAGAQIMSRQAFYEVGGWDPRFRGWGGEDHAAMRAMDTLYWGHKTLPGQFLHIWHPMISPGGSSTWVDWQYRMWSNQKDYGMNDRLSGRYWGANGHRGRMRRLIQEGLDNS